MKTSCRFLKKNILWILMLAFVDLFFCILLWIADLYVFGKFALLIILFSLILLFLLAVLTIRHEKKYHEAFRNYLQATTECNEAALINVTKDIDIELIQLLGDILRKRKAENQQLQARVSDYEEYVELWAHETKIPISLLTMLLDNHRDEIPSNILMKMDYVRNRMQQYVEQMLFYSRLKGGKKDYYFEEINIEESMEEVLEDYKPLLEEKDFVIHKCNLDQKVFTDKRAIRFILSQIISNAVKYVNTEQAGNMNEIGHMPELDLIMETDKDCSTLMIKDNGVGIKACDLPFIFEKGFTGDSGENRKKATGMGLYLVKKIGEDLKLELDVESEWMQGFMIIIKFLKV